MNCQQVYEVWQHAGLTGTAAADSAAALPSPHIELAGPAALHYLRRSAGAEAVQRQCGLGAAYCRCAAADQDEMSPPGGCSADDGLR